MSLKCYNLWNNESKPNNLLFFFKKNFRLAIDALQKHFYLANRNKLKGIFTLRQNHLKKFGVVVCEIKPQYWFHVPDSFDIRSTLLQDEIRKCLL